MDPKHSSEIFKHLEKQNELLMETYRAMSHELHRILVEEEMLMHKLYEMVKVEGLLKKEKRTGDESRNDATEQEKEH